MKKNKMNRKIKVKMFRGHPKTNNLHMIATNKANNGFDPVNKITREKHEPYRKQFI